MTVKNVSYLPHYLIHVVYNDLTSRDIHAHSKKALENDLFLLHHDSNVHDYYVYQGIDFDTEED